MLIRFGVGVVVDAGSILIPTLSFEGGRAGFTFFEWVEGQEVKNLMPVLRPCPYQKQFLCNQ